MTNTIARAFLRTGSRPDYWRGSRVVIVEGEKKLLQRLAIEGEGADSEALFGIVSGSWTQEIADRVPDGCRVVLRTDQNAAGLSYATKIARTLEARWRARRIELAVREGWTIALDARGRIEVRSAA
jgi:hypothetical protein